MPVARKAIPPMFDPLSAVDLGSFRRNGPLSRQAECKSLRKVCRKHCLDKNSAMNFQLPTYRAYKLRATAVSLVPLMMARPSGNNVIS